MHPVSMKEFYAKLGPLDVHPRIVSGWPFVSEWRIQSGPNIGKIVGKSVAKSSPNYADENETFHDYYLTD